MYTPSHGNERGKTNIASTIVWNMKSAMAKELESDKQRRLHERKMIIYPVNEMDWIGLQIRWWLNEIRSKYYRIKSNRMKKFFCNFKNIKSNATDLMRSGDAASLHICPINSIKAIEFRFWFFSLKIFRNSIRVGMMSLINSLWWSLADGCWRLTLSISMRCQHDFIIFF